MSKRLDIIDMKVLGDLFSSGARTELLRVLCYQPDGMALRALARTAGLRIRSAELALSSLVRDKLVKRSRDGNRVVFVLDRADVRYSILHAVFDAAMYEGIRADSRLLNERSKVILPFINEAKHMLNNAVARKGLACR